MYAPSPPAICPDRQKTQKNAPAGMTRRGGEVTVWSYRLSSLLPIGPRPPHGAAVRVGLAYLFQPLAQIGPPARRPGGPAHRRSDHWSADPATRSRPASSSAKSRAASAAGGVRAVYRRPRWCPRRSPPAPSPSRRAAAPPGRVMQAAKLLIAPRTPRRTGPSANTAARRTSTSGSVSSGTIASRHRPPAAVPPPRPAPAPGPTAPAAAAIILGLLGHPRRRRPGWSRCLTDRPGCQPRFGVRELAGEGEPPRVVRPVGGQTIDCPCSQADARPSWRSQSEQVGTAGSPTASFSAPARRCRPRARAAGVPTQSARADAGRNGDGHGHYPRARRGSGRAAGGERRRRL